MSLDRCGLFEVGQQVLDLTGAGGALVAEETQAGDEHGDVGAGGLGGAGRVHEGRGAQLGEQVVGREAADAMGAQEPIEARAGETVGGGGGGGQLEEGPQPEIIGGGAEGERLGVGADELLAQAVGEADEGLEVVPSRRDSSRSWTMRGSSGAMRRNAGRSVRKASPRTKASRRSSLAPATV